MSKRKTIGLQPSEYEVLSRAKEARQAETGEQTDWGQFLLALLGIYILYLVNKKKREDLKMAKLTCPHCQTLLSDDEHALGFEAPEGDPDVDEKIAQLFQGFVITLWKCPGCAVLIIEVEYEGQELFVGQIYNLVQPEAGGDHE